MKKKLISKWRNFEILAIYSTRGKLQWNIWCFFSRYNNKESINVDLSIVSWASRNRMWREITQKHDRCCESHTTNKMFSRLEYWSKILPKPKPNTVFFFGRDRTLLKSEILAKFTNPNRTGSSRSKPNRILQD